jgi:hypothetical protein
VLGFFMPAPFASLAFAMTKVCEEHTDAAYIASRRMAPHLYVPNTLCFGERYASQSSGQAVSLRTQQRQARGTSFFSQAKAR